MADHPIEFAPYGILHPTDFSTEGSNAFAHALKIALQHRGSLTMLHVDPKHVDDHHWEKFPHVRPTLAKWGLLADDAAHSAVAEQLGLGIEKIGAEGDIVGSILEYADHHPIRLIVLGTHGHQGVPKWLHRSVSEPIARHTHLPTLFVPHAVDGFVSADDGVAKISNILMPVDHDPDPNRAIPIAKQFLRDFGDAASKLTMLHIGDDVPWIKPTSDPVIQQDLVCRQGDPFNEIIAAAEEFESDLIVMVTAGHHGFLDAIRGSTTERVLRHAPCPVLAVPTSTL